MALARVGFEVQDAGVSMTRSGQPTTAPWRRHNSFEHESLVPYSGSGALSFATCGRGEPGEAFRGVMPLGSNSTPGSEPGGGTNLPDTLGDANGPFGASGVTAGIDRHFMGQLTLRRGVSGVPLPSLTTTHDQVLCGRLVEVEDSYLEQVTLAQPHGCLAVPLLSGGGWGRSANSGSLSVLTPVLIHSEYNPGSQQQQPIAGQLGAAATGSRDWYQRPERSHSYFND